MHSRKLPITSKVLLSVWVFEKLQFHLFRLQIKDNELKTYSSAHIAATQCACCTTKIMLFFQQQKRWCICLWLYARQEALHREAVYFFSAFQSCSPG